MLEDIIMEPGRTFREFSLLPGYTPKDCNIHSVKLESTITSNLRTRIPLWSAAMTSVTGYDMALALGKIGGMAVLPARLSIEEQSEIVRKIKSEEMKFVNPSRARNDQTVEQVLKKMDKYGNSHIPIIDENNVFKGMFILEQYWKVGGKSEDLITSVMIPSESNKIPIYQGIDITIEKAKLILEKSKEDYLVIIDEQGRLNNMAFENDMQNINIASAISTHDDWKERIQSNIDAGVDLISIDTSDAHGYFTKNVISKYKEITDVPICAGNIVTYEGAMMLMNSGADMIKIGMSSGSICSTQREKATGRAPMTALVDVFKAKKEYASKSGKDIPLIMDGGVSNSVDMIIALTKADQLMCGNYFNKFFEAAGNKYDKHGNITRLESEMVSVQTYGEGSDEARNLSRYGHDTMNTFFSEGESGRVQFAGRLKSNLKKDLLRLKAAMVNVGSMDLKEFREKARLELMSQYSKSVVGDIHNIEVSN